MLLGSVQPEAGYNCVRGQVRLSTCEVLGLISTTTKQGPKENVKTFSDHRLFTLAQGILKEDALFFFSTQLTPSELASCQALGCLTKANKSVYFGYWSPPLINQLYSQTVGEGQQTALMSKLL